MQTQDAELSSRVLASWLDGRPGGRARAGIEAILPENGTANNLTSDQLVSLLGASVTTYSGASVTPESALRVTAVYGCVALIAGAISTLPMGIYERTEANRKPVKHEYYWMLNEQANDDVTASTAFEYLVCSRLFYGDAFARLIRPSRFTNRVIGWETLHPSRVQPFRDADQTLYYRVTNLDGTVVVVDQADMIHVPSLGFDGLRSPSPITYAAREAIGNALGAERFSGQFFSQGSTHDIALKSKTTLTKEQAEQLRTNYLARNGGTRAPLILSGGLEVEKLSITPADAALLPTRQFSVEEICRVFGVPPFMIGATEKSTSFGAGLEEMGIAFVKYTLRRHLTPIEQEFNRKLWPTREKFFIEYNTSALERGDYKTRMEGYRIAVGRAGEPGWMTPNQVRNMENMEPIEGGDELHTGQPPAVEEAAPVVDTEEREARAEFRDVLIHNSKQQTKILAQSAAAATVAANREQLPTVVNVAPPTVNVTTPPVIVNVAEPVVNVEAVMPQPVVHVTAEASPAPVVNITNEITAQAAPAQVVVQTPTSSEARHERDEDGEIVRTLTTFRKD